jgi:TonB family protein
MRNAILIVAALMATMLSARAQTPSSQPVSTETTPRQILPNCDAYYPANGASGGTTGVGFLVDVQGNPASVHLIRSSRDSDLDAAAVSCMANSSLTFNFSKIPAERPLFAAVNGVAVRGDVIAAGSVAVNWVRNGHSTYFVGCPYPFVSARLKEQGEVELSYRILRDGTVSNPVVSKSSGYDHLDDAALACTANYRYTPALHDGVPVEIDWHVRMQFLSH